MGRVVPAWLVVPIQHGGVWVNGTGWWWLFYSPPVCLPTTECGFDRQTERKPPGLKTKAATGHSSRFFYSLDAETRPCVRTPSFHSLDLLIMLARREF